MTVMDMLELYHSIPEDAHRRGIRPLHALERPARGGFKVGHPWFASYALQRPQIAAVCVNVSFNRHVYCGHGVVNVVVP